MSERKKFKARINVNEKTERVLKIEGLKSSRNTFYGIDREHYVYKATKEKDKIISKEKGSKVIIEGKTKYQKIGYITELNRDKILYTSFQTNKTHELLNSKDFKTKKKK